MAKAAEIRGPAGDWHALRANPGYRADWRAHGGEPSVAESAGFALRVQAEADLEAARRGGSGGPGRPDWVGSFVDGGPAAQQGMAPPGRRRFGDDGSIDPSGR